MKVLHRCFYSIKIEHQEIPQNAIIGNHGGSQLPISHQQVPGQRNLGLILHSSVISTEIVFPQIYSQTWKLSNYQFFIVYIDKLHGTGHVCMFTHICTHIYYILYNISIFICNIILIYQIIKITTYQNYFNGVIAITLLTKQFLC